MYNILYRIDIDYTILMFIILTTIILFQSSLMLKLYIHISNLFGCENHKKISVVLLFYMLQVQSLFQLFCTIVTVRAHTVTITINFIEPQNQAYAKLNDSLYTCIRTVFYVACRHLYTYYFDECQKGGPATQVDTLPELDYLYFMYSFVVHADQPVRSMLYYM